MSFLRRHKQTISAALVVAVTIAVMGLTARERERITYLEVVLLEIVAPLQGALEFVTSSVVSVSDSIAEVRTLREENRRLEEEVARLSHLLDDLEELRRENERLRDLLGFASRYPYDTLAAEVIARSPGNWFSILTIDKGSRNGVVVDLPVVTAGGLVGRIVRVTPRTSTVMLITDPKSGVGAMIRRSRDAGVATGQLGSDPLLLLKMFSTKADVSPGDTVVTSGLSQIFPEGLKIGTVVEVFQGEFGLVTQATVRPAVDFDRLEEVLVILAWPRGEEAR